MCIQYGYSIRLWRIRNNPDLDILALNLLACFRMPFSVDRPDVPQWTSRPIGNFPPKPPAWNRFRTMAASVLTSAVAFLAPVAAAPVNVLTSHNDNARLGINTNETQLTRAVVGSSTFGKVFSYPVDGYVYAQPLVLTGVNVPGRGTVDLVFVVTEHDSVYAFDANDPSSANGGLVWQVSFINPSAGITTLTSGEVGSGDIVPEIGITATPVIDAAAGVIYVEAKTKEPGSKYVHRLHAMDVRSGAEMPNSPVVITASVKGVGDGTDGRGNVPFNALRQMARPGLSLVQTAAYPNPIVYIAYASHGDNGPYHGWLLGYDSKTLQQVHVYNSSPNGGLSGFWMAGNGPAIDADGNIYLITGNGGFNSQPTAMNFGDSYVKVGTSKTNLVLADWFTPFNQAALNGADTDLGSGGNMVLPDEAGSPTHPHLLVGCGKEGRIYVLDRDKMGGYSPKGDTNVVQFVLGLIGGTWSSPAYFKRRLYYQGAGDVLKALSISNATISTKIVSQSQQGFGYPGATPSISANGDQEGIAWVLQTDGYGSRSPAVLHAYNADNLGQELYNSSAAGGRDNPGPAVKYTVPTVANGKVYVGTANALAVFGAGNWVAAPTLNPPAGQFTDSILVTISDTTPGAQIHYTTDGTEPSLQSPLYSGAITLTNSAAIRAKAFVAGMYPSTTTIGTYLGPNSIGNGIGLRGDYYSNQLMTFNGTPALSRIDPSINFDWGGGSPDPSVSADHFTVRWTGAVKAQFTEPYTFYLTGDDGVRLWINGQRLVDAWQDQGPTEYSATVSFVAGQLYNIQVDYYENGGGAVAKLEWSSPSTVRQFIPTSQLFAQPPTPPNKLPSVAWVSPAPGSTTTGPGSMVLTASASDADGIVTSVTFLNGSKQIARLTNAPYTFTWTKVQPGTYTLFAVATDDKGATNTAQLAGVQVTAGTEARFGINNRAALQPFLGLPSNPQAPFPARLSDTGTFNDLGTLAPVNGFVAYGVNAPFWSDGALKRRWMGVPYDGGPIRPEQQVKFTVENAWQFPVGSVFVKHFDLQTNELDPQALRRLETRILVNLTNGIVYGASYRWRPDYSDADLVNTAQTEEITIETASGTRSQTWYYPSRTDCVTCHTAYSGGILGASKTRQLNRDWTYEGSGVTDNQIRTLNYIGLFSPVVDESQLGSLSKFDDIGNTNASVSERFRSFLDVNCSYCHQPGGVRGLFDARYTTPPANSGIRNGPLIAEGPIPGSKVLVPGDQLRSMILQRMQSLDPLFKMPPVGRFVVDQPAVDVTRTLIDQLAGPAPRLAMTHGPGVLHLSWPTTVTPFYLTESDGRLNSTNWAEISSGNPVNGRYNVDVPFSPGSAPGFLRLTSQRPLP